MVPCKSTAEEVSFEWSHHGISSTDSKVRIALHVSITDFGKERVKAPAQKVANLAFSPDKLSKPSTTFSGCFPPEGRQRTL